MNNKSLIAIVGPTATGKSAVAIELALKINGEIISADSAQVYKGLDIGTAKIKAAESCGIQHHLIDIVGPETEYNASLFCDDALKAIDSIRSKNKIPILCGGSGLYINALIYQGNDLGSVSPDNDKREYYRQLEKNMGNGYLYGLLSAKFPRRAAKIHPHDYQRIIRALELTADLSDTNDNNRWLPRYDLAIFGLKRQRDLLYRGIEKRVDSMFVQGLKEEVAAALEHGYLPGSNAMSALGYKEIIPLLRGEIDEATAINNLKKNTRHFAKRQITWFKRDPNILWFDVDAYTGAKEISADIFNRLQQDKFIN